MKVIKMNAQVWYRSLLDELEDSIISVYFVLKYV